MTNISENGFNGRIYCLEGESFKEYKKNGELVLDLSDVISSTTLKMKIPLEHLGKISAPHKAYIRHLGFEKAELVISSRKNGVPDWALKVTPLDTSRKLDHLVISLYHKLDRAEPPENMFELEPVYSSE